jgi:TetR/AcrR family transcriptional regulator
MLSVERGLAERTRDAERTREAILVAAEDRFARLGFDGTSIQQIAEAAGVARSTPAYFFGSKEDLYDAVLERVVARGQETMARAYAAGDEAPSAEDAVESYVGAFLDFLSHDHNFLRLLQREALGDGSRIADFFGSAVAEGIAALGPAAAKAGISPERLALDLTALCWYPFAHEHTVLPALGMKARDPAFLDEHKRHLGDLVRAMTRPGRERPSRRHRSQEETQYLNTSHKEA